MRLSASASRINCMKQKLRQIFENISGLEPAPKLAGFILAKIERERKKIIREKKALAWAGLFGSALAAAYTILVFGQEILQSDFWRIILLSFSDMNVVAGNWHDYVLSLLETLPALHAALILVPIFVLLISLNAYFALINKNNHKRI